jgi:hypothetical protein
MDRQNTTRILLEGGLNGIGFVIGSALVGLIVSIFLIIAHHLTPHSPDDVAILSALDTILI